MRLAWKVDQPSNDQLWKPLRQAALSCASEGSHRQILDIGGGGGSFGAGIRALHPGARLVVIDIAPFKAVEGAVLVKGDARFLPFRSSKFDTVVARALLHHLPSEIDRVVEEAARVCAPDGIFVVQEPCAGNLPARFARMLVSTTAHEPGERPLQIEVMVAAISRHFAVRGAEWFFLISYLAPHILSRVRKPLLASGRRLAALLGALDAALLRAMPSLRRYAAYVHICAAEPFDHHIQDP
ncbi:MAG: class I SAM-dependent methyltransferase [Candidatus Thermoplasmatota archaeon]